MSNRLLNEGQNKGFYGECVLEIGANGLNEIRQSGSTFRTWTSVERIVTTPSHLFIYTAGIEAYIVPHRAFSRESAFLSFVNTINQHSGVVVQVAE